MIDDPKTVVLDVADSIATILLNRPESLNTLSLEMAGDLAAVCERVRREDTVRCVIIRGAGGNFMAGGDINAFQEALRELDDSVVNGIIDQVHSAIKSLRGMRPPVVACVEGAVAGFGMSLLMACDLAIATEQAKFTLAYSLIGASPDGGSTYHLPRIVGLKRAMEIALLSDRFSAQHAYELGLVNYVVPETDLEAATATLAERLVKGPAQAHARIKELLNESLSNTLEEQLQREHAAFVAGTSTPEFAEGVAAFCEKRKANFT